MKRFRIGRAESNEIVLNDPSVSREHAELVKIDRAVFLLRDLGSTYGTSARHGSDWHLVTAENVTYATPIRSRSCTCTRPTGLVPSTTNSAVTLRALSSSSASAAS